tara:strand:+ start:9385 stop:10593 length:1209 start_codon:yes stop_codon:yes gene_type:complete
MDKVLVKKAVSAQYPVGAGAPIMVLGSGGRGGRARTIRESAGGLAGGALGALGALTGQHRSLGSLVQSGISGAAQGGAIGRGLGRVLVGPESQARANLRREMADKYSAARASGEFDRYGVSSRRTPRTRVGVSMRANEMGSSLYDLEQAKQAEKDMLAQQRAEAMARARAQGTQFGTQQRKDAEAMAAFRRETGLDPNMAASQFMGPMGAAIRERQQQGSQPSSVGQLPPPSKEQGEPIPDNLPKDKREKLKEAMAMREQMQRVKQARQAGKPIPEMNPVNDSMSAFIELQRQNQQRRNQPVDAKGQPLPANLQLMPPSPSAQDASAYSQIVDIEDAGNQEAMQTGTDMKDSMEVESEEGGMTEEQLRSFAESAGRANMRQRTPNNTQQIQDNRRQSRLSEF